MFSKFTAFAILSLVVLGMFAFPAFFSGVLMFAAIVPAGLVGNLSGKTGNFVFAKWKSIKTLRAYQPQVRQSDSQALAAQRLRFSLIQHVASVAINFIKSGFRNYATNMSEYNYFMKQNLSTGTTGVYPNIVRDYAELKFSAGTLLGANDASITSADKDGFTITFTDNSGEANALNSDLASCLLVCEGSELTGIVKSTAPQPRENGECSTTLPLHWIGKTVHVYLTFVSADGQLVSDSQYVGDTVVIA